MSSVANRPGEMGLKEEKIGIAESLPAKTLEKKKL